MNETDDFVVCRICGKRFQQITHTHLNWKHNMTSEEYRARFPQAPMMSKKRQKRLNALNTNRKHTEEAKAKMRAIAIEHHRKRASLVDFDPVG